MTIKKITFFAAALLLLAACTKDHDIKNTSWKWSSEATGFNSDGDTLDVMSNYFEIKFETSTHGHAYLSYSRTNYWDETPHTNSIYGVFDVSYKFNGEEGTVSFTKEHCEGVNIADEYLAEFWNDPITSSFYTYADDSKMLLYSYPSSMAHYTSHIMVLTKE